nr:Cyclin-like F-box, putative [Medicago truncatula]
MFDYNTIQDLPKSLPLFQRFHFQSEFATRLDQFVLHYKGDMISSIRVKFPLGNEHRDAIDRLISKGIAKGAKRIELLFSSETNDTTHSILPYKFSLTLLSDNDSLTYLHLQNCLVLEPMNLSGLKNLRTLVFHLVDVKQKLLQSLSSNCSHLLDFTLDDCHFTSSLIINIPTLLRLNIVNCRVNIERYIDIIASNLSSFEYSCNDRFRVHPINIKSHMLSKFIYRGARFSKPIGFFGLKNVTTIVLDGLTENLSGNILNNLFSDCFKLENATFKNCCLTSSTDITSQKLRHLSIIDCGFGEYSPYAITIDALNLLSFEYSGQNTHIIYVTAPKLLKIFWNAAVREKIPHPFGPIESLPHIENLAMIIYPSQVANLG